MRPVTEILGPEWNEFLPHADKLLEPIYDQLKFEKEQNIPIYPSGENVFRAFHDLTPQQIKIVWLGQDPYHSPAGQATGRSFECGKYVSSSWKKVRKVYEDYCVSMSIEPDYDVLQGKLNKWANQGVFLLNRALTVRFSQPGSHIRIWDEFIHYVVKSLITDMQPRAYILLGGEAKRLIPKVPHPSKGFYYEHPVAASYKGRPWDAKDLFKEVKKFTDFHDCKINL